MLSAVGKDVSWAELTSAITQVKTFNFHLPSPPHSASPLYPTPEPQNKIQSNPELVARNKESILGSGYFSLSSLLQGAWSRGRGAGHVIFIQRAQPDTPIILTPSLCMCLSSLVLKMVQYVMGRLEVRSNKGKLLEGRAKTFHLRSLLIKNESSYYYIISVQEEGTFRIMT